MKPITQGIRTQGVRDPGDWYYRRCRDLIAGIVLQAIELWPKVRAQEQPDSHLYHWEWSRDLGFATPREDLEAFFDGDLFRLYCDLVDLDPDLVLERIGYHAKDTRTA